MCGNFAPPQVSIVCTCVMSMQRRYPGIGCVSPMSRPHGRRSDGSRSNRGTGRALLGSRWTAPLTCSRALPAPEASVRRRRRVRRRRTLGRWLGGLWPANQAGYHARRGDEVCETRLALHHGAHRGEPVENCQTVNTVTVPPSLS